MARSRGGSATAGASGSGGTSGSATTGSGTTGSGTNGSGAAASGSTGNGSMAGTGIGALPWYAAGAAMVALIAGGALFVVARRRGN